jgi:putative transposase
MNAFQASDPQENGARKSPSTLHTAEVRQFPARLHHEVPPWVVPGSVFHIRVRCELRCAHSLTDGALAAALLDSVRFFHARQRWFVDLFLLMPDHWHALLSFPPAGNMSRVIGDWKRFQKARHQVAWQDGYFDHRIRDDHEFELKAGYIRQNPVVKGLCARAGDWRWVWPQSLDGAEASSDLLTP